MNKRLAISLIATSLLASSAALLNPLPPQARRMVLLPAVKSPVRWRNGRRYRWCCGRRRSGNPERCVWSGPRGEPSVTVHERVVVGEPLPETVVPRPVPSHTEYRYAVVNDRRVIVEPCTRKIIKIID